MTPLPFLPSCLWLQKLLLVITHTHWQCVAWTHTHYPLEIPGNHSFTVVWLPKQCTYIYWSTLQFYFDIVHVYIISCKLRSDLYYKLCTWNLISFFLLYISAYMISSNIGNEWMTSSSDILTWSYLMTHA